MGNCLVTKLKSTVDNDSLRKLGIIKFDAEIRQSDGRIVGNLTATPLDGKQIHFTRISPTGLTFASPTNGGIVEDPTHATLVSAESTLGVSGLQSEKSMTVEIREKYDLKTLRLVRSSNINLSELEYCTGLTRLNVSNVTVPNENRNTFGDISSLSNLVNLQELDFNYLTRISGDIKSLGKLINLTTLNFAVDKSVAESYVTGNWVDFVAAQRTNGRTTCSGITLNNAVDFQIKIGTKTPIFYDDSSHPAIISWDATAIDLAMAANSRAYVYGYTEQQIEDMKESGGKYEGWLVFNASA